MRSKAVYHHATGEYKIQKHAQGFWERGGFILLLLLFDIFIIAYNLALLATGA